jgi:UDP-glucose 4-epimerase
MKVLVTGATGYIGAHTCKILHERGHTVHGLDIDFDQNDISKYCAHVIHADVTEVQLTEAYDAVVHLAGLISVKESTEYPTSYYHNNLNGTLHILAQMPNTHMVFASTAGAFDPQSPYARSKIACEDVIKEISNAYTIFRFFNVAGSDGENSQQGESTHLIRIAAETAALRRDLMYVYGTDYNTRDGSCVRDYVHVVDLANAIANAVEAGPVNTPYECIGSGNGYTVWEVIDTMVKVTETSIMAIPEARREGDPASLVIDNQYKGLKIKHTLEDMCFSAYMAELRRSVQ